MKRTDPLSSQRRITMLIISAWSVLIIGVLFSIFSPFLSAQINSDTQSNGITVVAGSEPTAPAAIHKLTPAAENNTMQWYDVPENNIVLAIIVLIITIFGLYYSSDKLVDSSAEIATDLGMRKAFVGLTIVAFGTSMPEFIVSFIAAMNGKSAICFGNIIGSNIANLALVIGIAALITPMIVDKKLLFKEALVMLGASALLIFFTAQDGISRFEAIFFVSLLGAYLIWSILRAKQPSTGKETHPHLTAKVILVLIGSMILLFLSARYLIQSTIIIAHALNIPEIVISISVIALGTSLPELVTSIVAIIKKEHEISMGNLIGSNIFNICGVIGITGLITRLEFNFSENLFSLLAMMGFAILIWIFMITGKVIRRWEGALVLLLYTIYIIIIFVI